MALQVRRGTNAERIAITPLEGELVFTTDTKQLYVGDGATAGGITSIANTIDSLLADTTPQLGGELDLNGNSITGIGSINITGTINASGNINLGDGIGSDIVVFGGAIQGHLVPDTDTSWNLGAPTKQFNEVWISQLNVENQLTVGRIQGDLIADDSTVVFDASTGLIAAAQLTGTFTGDVIGNITGNANGSHTGTFDGDVTGSIFGDNSSLIIDGTNNTLYGALTGSLVGDVTGDITGSVFLDNSSLVIDGQFGDIYPRRIVSDGLLRITRPAAATTNFIQMESNDQYTSLSLLRTSDSDLTGTNQRYGQLRFGKDDSTGRTDSNIISGNEDFLWIFNGADGAVTDSKLLALSEGDVGIGTVTPAAKLDVQGAIKPGVYADDAARDAAITSPVAGMMIFNTTDTKFQGYTGSAWVDLN